MNKTQSKQNQSYYKKAVNSEVKDALASISLDKPRFYKNHAFKPSKVEGTMDKMLNEVDTSIEDIYVKSVTIKSNQINVFVHPFVKREKKGLKRVTDKNLTRGKYNGYISKATKSKIRNTLETWVSSVAERRKEKKHRYEKIGYYISFMTLSLASSQIHDDNEIKRELLMPYIEYLKRVKGVKNYYWKAEPQKNGNIHFHLIIDKFIDKKEVQTSWNVQQNKLGYVDRYFEKSGDINPPSTHIVALPKGSKGISYLLKYASKSSKLCNKGDVYQGVKIKKQGIYDYVEDKVKGIEVYEVRKIKGRIWGCSDVLKMLKPFRIDFGYMIEGYLKDWENKGLVRSFSEEYFSCYFGEIEELLFKNIKWLYYKKKRYLSRLFKAVYKDYQMQLEHIIEKTSEVIEEKKLVLDWKQSEINFST